MNPALWPALPVIDLIAIDPGETTGFIELVGGQLHRSYSANYEWFLEGLHSGQIGRNLYPTAGKVNLLPIWVMENFLIYPWKAEQLAFNLVIPAKLIGAVDCFLRSQKPRPRLYLQTAQNAKQFINDKVIDHYFPDQLGNKHERDAARHALYFLIAGEGKNLGRR